MTEALVGLGLMMVLALLRIPIAVAMARPPRRWPMQVYAARKSCCDMPARVTKFPISIKSGTTESV